MRRFWLLFPLLAGCHGDAVAPPTPGTLTVQLSTPNQSDGAVVFVISGGPVSAVHVVGSLEVVQRVDGAGTHVMVIGDVIGGPLVTFDVPDRSRANVYVATIEQIADRATFALLDPGSYRLTIVLQP